MTAKPSKPLIISSAPITSNTEILPETHLIWLESPQIAATARPGQFVMARCGEDTLLRRPLSIHQIDGDRLALLFKIVGRGTDWLAQCKTGETVDIFGPLGNGYTIHPNSKNLLLVAGGIGIAPLRFLADVAVSQEKKVTLLMGASSAVNLLPIIPIIHVSPITCGIPPEEMLPFNINVVTATDDGSEGFKGPVTDLIAAYIDHGDQIFACGPVGMYRTMARMPELKGRPVQVSLEIMMGCGIGVCYGCTMKTKSGLKQVCKDGPMFDLEDIMAVI
jgi:dihydroorotate dehydrogenase electron transfer subunit